MELVIESAVYFTRQLPIAIYMYYMHFVIGIQIFHVVRKCTFIGSLKFESVVANQDYRVTVLTIVPRSQQHLDKTLPKSYQDLAKLIRKYCAGVIFIHLTARFLTRVSVKGRSNIVSVKISQYDLK